MSYVRMTTPGDPPAYILRSVGTWGVVCYHCGIRGKNFVSGPARMAEHVREHKIIEPLASEIVAELESEAAAGEYGNPAFEEQD